MCSLFHHCRWPWHARTSMARTAWHACTACHCMSARHQFLVFSPALYRSPRALRGLSAALRAAWALQGPFWVIWRAAPPGAGSPSSGLEAAGWLADPSRPSPLNKILLALFYVLFIFCCCAFFHSCCVCMFLLLWVFRFFLQPWFLLPYNLKYVYHVIFPVWSMFVKDCCLQMLFVPFIFTSIVRVFRRFWLLHCVVNCCVYVCVFFVPMSSI